MKKIEEFMLSIGGHVSNKGFDVICAAYEMIQAGEIDPAGKVMEMYTTLAKQFGITPNSAERSIRHEITRIYNQRYTPLPDFLAPDEDSGKLPNKEFITRLVKFVD